MRRSFKIVLIALLALLLVVAASFLPVLWRKAAGMQTLEGAYVRVYFQRERAAAEDVFRRAEAAAAGITETLGLSSPPPIDIFIYDSQRQMQSKKYGLLIPLLGLTWYIGDNIGDDVILTSPASTETAHSYDAIRDAALHEMVHAYVYTINPSVRLWLTEGMALYLINGQPFSRGFLDRQSIPSLEDTRTGSPLRFSDMGGYTYAHTYIEYLDRTYGWASVLQLIAGQKYEAVFGKTEETVYAEWVAWLENDPDIP